MSDNIINKVIYGSRTLIDLTSDTVEAQYLKSGYTAHDKSGQVITGTLTNDLQSKSVSFIPAETLQTSTISFDSGYDGLSQVDISVAAISSTYVGTGITRLSSSDLIISGSTITAPTGYYSSNAAGTVASGSAFTPAVTITTNPSISINSSTGVITASYSGSSSITPTVNTGYISQGTAGVVSTAGTNTLSLNTQSASTITPTELVQTAVSANTYTTGTVQVGAISSTYVGSGIDRNDSDDLTISGDTITAAAGYYSSAATKTIEAGSATTPTTTITANPTISINTTTGLITATTTSSKSVTPTVEAGYISEGTAGTITVSGSNTSQLTTQTASTITPTESEQIAVSANTYTLGQVKVGAISSDYVGSNIPQNSAADLSISGPTITVPTGYYSSNVTGTVDSGNAFTPAITITQNPTVTINSSTGVVTATYTGSSSITPTVTAGYISVGTAGTVSTSGSATLSLSIQAAETVTPTESEQIAVDANKYTTGQVKVGAISSTYVGSNIPHYSSADLTASGSTITTPAGYYSSDASKSIAGGTATTPATTITANPSISIDTTTGLITATYSGNSSIAPTVSPGYISQGTAGTVSTTGTNTLSLSTLASTSYTPTTSDQFITAGQYLIGSQTIKGDPNLLASYIKSGITIFGVEGELVSGATVIHQEQDPNGGTITYITTENLVSGTKTITTNSVYDVASFTYADVYVLPDLQSKTIDFIPDETLQSSVVTYDSTYDGLSKVTINVSAISSDYVGTNIARISAADLTISGPTITAPTGYYSSALQAAVDSGSAFTPAVTIITNPTVTINSTTGVITASYTGSSSITPTVTEGYISTGTAGTVSTSGSGTLSLTTQVSATITPTESEQVAVGVNKYTIGQVKVAAISSTYVGSGVPTNSAADLTASGPTVTVPSGFYSSEVSKDVTTASAFAPAISLNSSTGVITGTNTFAAGYYTASTKTSTVNLSVQAASTITPTENIQTAVSAGYFTTGVVSVAAISSDYVGSNVPRNSSADLTASGSTVTVPVGYYSSSVSKSVDSGSAFTPAITITTNPTITLNSTTGVITANYTGSSSITPTVTAGYIATGTAGTVSTAGTNTYSLTTQAGTTITPTESAQVAVSAGKYTLGVISVAAISSTYVGTGVTQNSAADLTASNSTVTVPSGYYASEVTKDISTGNAFTPAITITTNPTVTIDSTTGIVTATYTSSSSVTPTVTAGYISVGTAGIISTAGTNTLQLTSKAAATYTPTTSDQFINANQFLIGSQTIKGDANLIASNIASGVSIFGVVGTHVGGITPTGTYSITSNGIYDITSYASVDVDVSPGYMWQDLDGGVHLSIDGTLSALVPITISVPGTYYPSSGQAFNAVVVDISADDGNTLQFGLSNPSAPILGGGQIGYAVI